MWRKASAGDVIWFMATVNRIAEILAARGDTDPVGARRPRAVGILARPAEALRLLMEHQHDPDRPAESSEPGETAEPGDLASQANLPSRRAQASLSPAIPWQAAPRPEPES